MPDDCLTPAGFLDAEGLWRLACGDLSWARGRAALFLDRDGVVVEEVDYLHRVEDLALIPGAAELIAEANRRGIPVVIASNQAGIARGYFGWHEFQQVQAELNRRLERAAPAWISRWPARTIPNIPTANPAPACFGRPPRWALSIWAVRG